MADYVLLKKDNVYLSGPREEVTIHVHEVAEEEPVKEEPVKVEPVKEEPKPAPVVEEKKEPVKKEEPKPVVKKEKKEPVRRIPFNERVSL